MFGVERLIFKEEKLNSSHMILLNHQTNPIKSLLPFFYLIAGKTKCG